MAEILLSKCAKFRLEEEFIDVRLKVRDNVFPAHRIVLAANSDYFHAMFTNGMKESKEELIELKDESISAEALKIVLDSIYGETLRVNKNNVFEVLAAANHFQITNVVHQCCELLEKEFVQARFHLERYCQLTAVADELSLPDLLEAVQHKMASRYKEICDSEEFLSQIDANELTSLLKRDDLSAASETSIFKSVMRWVKYKKEERIPVAAKVLDAVRLGLVDIATLIEELSTEEMQRVADIQKILLDASLYFNAPSQMSKFAKKTKPRAASSVLLAIKPKWSQAQFFDFESKLWKPVPSMAVIPGAESCVCAELVGNSLYVAMNDANGSHVCCYNVDKNLWDKLPPLLSRPISNLCTMGDYLYAITSDYKQVQQRYSFTKRQWQSIARIELESYRPDNFSLDRCSYNGAVVVNSKLYAVYQCRYIKLEYRGGHSSGRVTVTTRRFVVYCFDEEQNRWQRKASLGSVGCHFGSCIFVANNRLVVAGGHCSVDSNGVPVGDPAVVAVYDEQKEEWFPVEQKHIPPNNLGAVEIEGRVSFIMNKIPVDSGIRIPPGEVFPVCLGEWEDIGKVGEDSALCYLPLKENMKN